MGNPGRWQRKYKRTLHMDDIIELPLDRLTLDSANPRLPDSIRGASERTLVKYIAETYNAISIGRSIALFGYFGSEPLVVIPAEENTYVVVEGNRRLVALRILSDPSIAAGFDDAREWCQQGARVEHFRTVPVVVAQDRRAVAPVIGYRHISGIEQWDPFPKARFIAGLVDDQQLSFEDVADLVGETKTAVAAHYRNYAIAKQAQDDFGIDTALATERFGVFTRMMTSLHLRTHIGAAAPAGVVARARPLADDNASNLGELFSWVFGDESFDAVIEDSRQMTDLGTIVASEDGLEILRATRNMEAAFGAAGGLRNRLVTRLGGAASSLEEAREDMTSYGQEEEIRLLLDRCRFALDRLLEYD